VKENSGGGGDEGRGKGTKEVLEEEEMER